MGDDANVDSSQVLVFEEFACAVGEHVNLAGVGQYGLECRPFTGAVSAGDGVQRDGVRDGEVTGELGEQISRFASVDPESVLDHDHVDAVAEEGGDTTVRGGVVPVEGNRAW